MNKLWLVLPFLLIAGCLQNQSNGGSVAYLPVYATPHPPMLIIGTPLGDEFTPDTAYFADVSKMLVFQNHTLKLVFRKEIGGYSVSDFDRPSINREIPILTKDLGSDFFEFTIKNTGNGSVNGGRIDTETDLKDELGSFFFIIFRSPHRTSANDCDGRSLTTSMPFTGERIDLKLASTQLNSSKCFYYDQLYPDEDILVYLWASIPSETSLDKYKGQHRYLRLISFDGNKTELLAEIQFYFE